MEGRRDRESGRGPVTFGDIVMLSEEDRGGAGAAMQHERLGEHAPGRKQEADISLTPQR